MTQSQVRRGQDVEIVSAYSARCFELAAAEQLAAGFAAFRKDGRAACLHQLRPGMRFATLTDANDGGWVYVGVELGGKRFACQLLAGTYRVA